MGPLECMGPFGVRGPLGLWGPLGCMGPLECMGPFGVWGPLGCMGPLGCTGPNRRFARVPVRTEVVEWEISSFARNHDISPSVKEATCRRSR